MPACLPRFAPPSHLRSDLDAPVVRAARRLAFGLLLATAPLPTLPAAAAQPPDDEHAEAEEMPAEAEQEGAEQVVLPAAGLRRAAIRLAPALRLAPIARLAPPVGQEGVAAAEADPEKPEWLGNGALSQLSGVLEQVADVGLAGDRIAVSRISNMQQFQQTFYSNAHLFGGGGSSASGNGQLWTMAFHWTRLHGWAKLSQQGDELLEVSFAESDGLQQQLHYLVRTDGTFELTVWSPATPSYVQLVQPAGEPLRATLLFDRTAIRRTAPTVSQLMKSLPAEARQRLLATASGMGIPFPPTPYDPEVILAASQRLTATIDPAESDAFRERVAGLDADDFEARELATKRLLAEFGQWRTSIEQSLDDPSHSLEASSRLRRVYREGAGERAGATWELLVDLRLLDEPSFLLLVAESGTPEVQAAVFERLRELTERSLPDDVAAWKSALGVDESTESEGEEAIAADASQAPPFVADGRLNRLSDEMRTIAGFRVESGALVLDRERWSVSLQGKSVAEVNTEIREQVEAYGLPASLWQGSQLESLGPRAYPVIRVMRLETIASSLAPAPGMHMHHSTSYGVNADPQFSINGLAVGLRTSPPELMNGGMLPMNAPLPEIYHFSFEELAEAQRQLRFGCDVASGRTYVAIREAPVGFLIALAGSPADGWTLHCLQGNDAVADQAATIDELVGRHRELFDERLGAGLTLFGAEHPWQSDATR